MKHFDIGDVVRAPNKKNEHKLAVIHDASLTQGRWGYSIVPLEDDTMTWAWWGHEDLTLVERGPIWKFDKRRGRPR